MSKTYKRKVLRLFYFIFILSAILFCIACSKGSDSKEEEMLLLGSWKVKIKNTHKIIIFKTNNTFLYQERVEGRFSKIVEKKGNLTGTWLIKGELLSVTITDKGSDIDVPWKQDETIVFNIVELTKENLIFLEQNGKEYKWEKVRSKKAVIEEQGQFIIKLEPIIVNLKKTSSKKKWYLCLEMEFVFELSEHNINAVHPKVQEFVIFFLSSLEYNDVSKLKKTNSIHRTLKKKLYPYYGDRLKDVLISKVIVTTKTDEVEKFIQQAKEKEATASKKKE